MNMHIYIYRSVIIKSHKYIIIPHSGSCAKCDNTLASIYSGSMHALWGQRLANNTRSGSNILTRRCYIITYSEICYL